MTAKEAGIEERAKARVSDRPLWYGLFAGPVAWGLQLLFLCGAVSWFACDMGWSWLLNVISIVAAGIAVSGMLVALRAWQKLDEGFSLSIHAFGSRPGFMAISGVMLSLLCLIGIVFAGVPNVVIGGCG
jgi:hypothetical protein